MSGPTLIIAFIGIFALVFGGMFLVLRATSAKQAEADDEKPLTPGKPSKDAALIEKLRLGGVRLTPQQYRQRVLRGAIGAGALGWIMGGMGVGGILFGGILAIVAYRGGAVWLDSRVAGRMNEFIDQFTDALGVMANGVKSGQTVLQTMETISQDFQDPIQSEVEEVLQELRMGVPMDDALTAWAVRMPVEDLEIATTALIVQRQTGGNVAEILETVATTIRERNKLYKQIRTLTTQGRMSGWVLGLLPVALFLAMFLIAPERTGLLLSHPIGMVMTAIGAGAIATGAFFIKKIVTIEV